MDFDPPAPPEEFRDFGKLLDRAQGVSSGLYRFVLESKSLKAALSAVSSAAGKSLSGKSVVRVTLLPTGEIKLGCSNQALALMAECLAPAKIEVADLPAFGTHFVMELPTLTRVANVIGHSLECTYLPDKSSLAVTAGDTRVQVATIAAHEFVPFHSKLQNPKYVRELPRDILWRAITHASLFARDEPAAVSVADINVLDHRYTRRVGDKIRFADVGLAVGGSLTATAVFQAQALLGTNIKIRRDAVSVVGRVLTALSPEDLHLFEAPSFYLIRDKKTFLSFEKGSTKFPEKYLQACLNQGAEHTVLVPRLGLVNSMRRLEVGGGAADSVLQIGLSEANGSASLALSFKDMAGRLSEDKIPATPRKAETRPSYNTAGVRVADLAQVATHATGTTIGFAISQSGVLLFDTGDGFTAMSILMNVRPAN